MEAGKCLEVRSKELKGSNLLRRETWEEVSGSRKQ